jgi:MFS family permease
MTRDLVLVAASLFTWGLGEGMFLYFQPLYLQQWGADSVTIGWILGAAGIIMALAQLPAGYLADRIGAKWIMFAAWALGAVATLMMALAPSLSLFSIGLIIYAMTGFGTPPMNSYIAAVRGKLEVGRALTIVSFAYNFGAIVGPTIGGLLANRFGLAFIYRISAGIFVISTIIIYMIHSLKPEKHSEEEIHATLFQNKGFMVFMGLVFLTGFAGYLPISLTPNTLQNVHHLSVATIGQLGSIGSIGTALVLLTLGSLRPSIGFLVGQVLAMFFALLMWKGTGVFWFGAGYFFISGYRFSRSMILAYGRTLVRVSETGFAYGVIEVVNSATVIAAPPIAGYLYNRDPLSVYSISLVLIVIAFLINLITLPILKKRTAG